MNHGREFCFRAQMAKSFFALHNAIITLKTKKVSWKITRTRIKKIYVLRAVRLTMLPKIKTGYPVTIHSHAGSKVGIVCDISAYASGILGVVYVDEAFTARRTQVIWHESYFTWLPEHFPGQCAENDPELQIFVTTVKNGRY